MKSYEEIRAMGADQRKRYLIGLSPQEFATYTAELNADVHKGTTNAILSNRGDINSNRKGINYLYVLAIIEGISFIIHVILA